MAKTKLHQLSTLGQSIWLDYISRSLLESGKLKNWIDKGLRGMTSNPTIFDQAISQSTDYDEKITELRQQGRTPFEIYDALTIFDIQQATDFFKPVFVETQGLDGYVSLEINPKLAHQTRESIDEGKRLFKAVNRPNLMIKVPATEEGFPVVEELLAGGINVNVTLIFSLEHYRKTARAFLKGLERFSKQGGDISKVRSVASVFVSRVDTSVDKMLEERISQESDAGKKKKLSSLMGKAAVANSRIIFEE